MAISKSKLISSVIVTGLFGKYDYEIPQKRATDPSLNRTIFIYGDNGCGKTTVLRLVFHALATAEKAGHRTFLSRTKFRTLVITLDNGTKVSCAKTGNDLLGTFKMSVKKKNKRPVEYEFEADEGYAIPVNPTEPKEYYEFLSALSEIKLSLFFLTDTRTIMIDEPVVNYRMQRRSSLSISESVIMESRRLPNLDRNIDAEEVARELVRNSVKQVEAQLRNLSIRAASRSEINVNTLYREIIKRLASSEIESFDTATNKAEILKRLQLLEEASSRFARFGLLPKFNSKQFHSSITDTQDDKIEIMLKVLSPYLDSLESKYKTLSELQESIGLFVDAINSFYKDKSIRLDVRRGLTIRTNDGEILEPDQLSSGERQLLLLFCNTILAIEKPSLVLIDEPELSLNIKWQRLLIPSLIKFVATYPVQFIFATHSFEIISKYVDNLTKLGS